MSSHNQNIVALWWLQSVSVFLPLTFQIQLLLLSFGFFYWVIKCTILKCSVVINGIYCIHNGVQPPPLSNSRAVPPCPPYLLAIYHNSSFLLAPGSYQPALCLYEFACSGHCKRMESYMSFMTGFLVYCFQGLSMSLDVIVLYPFLTDE